MELLDFLTMDKERIFAGADAGAFDRSSDGPEAAPALPQMAVEGIHAGFPSPAQSYMEPCIDLNRELVRHPAATFYGRVVGDSMTDAGVEEGDILVIDRSIEAADGDMCVCFVDVSARSSKAGLSWSCPTMTAAWCPGAMKARPWASGWEHLSIR